VTRPLCVLSVSYTLAACGPDAVGGSEQVLAALDRALVERGHRSLVVGCRGSRVAGDLIVAPTDGETCAQIDDAIRAAAQDAFRRTIAHALRAHPVDVVHMHGYDFHDVLPAPGVPVLATLHMPPDWYWPHDSLQPTRPGTWLHGVSWSQHARIPPGPHLLPPIGNGVPVARLGAARHARRGFALTLARICPEKGTHLALDAARAAGVPLLIGGAVFPYSEHQAYYADDVRPRLGRWWRHLGPLPFARKRRLLSAARCLLVPTLAPETSSLVAMEAAACGTPVIAFGNGALPEIVQHGVTGFLVQDAAEMAEAIRRADRIDPEACRQAARDRFSDVRMADAYLARYRQLAPGDVMSVPA
jgi:glycosyltransferase involved in cell wall biosynthesis